jgi:MraZ protein
MDRFVSTFTNKIDAKGRVSIPAPFRAVLERDGYTGGTAGGNASGGGAAPAPISGGGIYCYPSLDSAALDAGGERLARKIDALLANLADYSDERDELSVALYGDVQVLHVDADGRIVLPESLRAHAGLIGPGSGQVTFVGLGDKFQIWEPAQFDLRRAKAREKVQEHRKLFGGVKEGG